VRRDSPVLPSIDALSERKVAVTGVPFIAQISLRKKNTAFSRKFPLAYIAILQKKDFHFKRFFYGRAHFRFPLSFCLSVELLVKNSLEKLLLGSWSGTQPMSISHAHVFNMKRKFS
jgi:hypothetical protein